MVRPPTAGRKRSISPWQRNLVATLAGDTVGHFRLIG